MQRRTAAVSDHWRHTTLQTLSIAMLSIHSSPLGALGTKNTGGMSVVIREMAAGLASLGHRVDIYTADTNGYREKIVFLDKNVRLIHLDQHTDAPIPKTEMFHHLPRYYEAMNAFVGSEGVSYDLLHSHYWLSGSLGQWARRDWAVPHVITYHTLGRLKNDFGPKADEPSLRMAWERRLSQLCDRVLVATRREKSKLIEHCEIDDSKVAVVPYGVDTKVFGVQNSLEARQQIGMDADASVILFVGRFVTLKGIERLMKAVAMIGKPENLRLLLVGGDGPDAGSTKKLKHLSRRMGIRQKVTFAGPIEHSKLVPYYNAADLLMLPSYYESFGLVALESLACGTPVVATPVGIVESVVENGKNGAIVEDQTVASMAKSMARVLDWVKAGKMPPYEVRASVLNYAWHGVANAVCREYVKTIETARSIERGPRCTAGRKAGTRMH
jgi:D-inositol-3-phosphate glycosyltransferase